MSHRALDVLGRPLAPETDVVLHHEHLVCDITCWHQEDADPRTLATVGEADLDDVRSRPWAYRDNLRLDDLELVGSEVDTIPARTPAVVDVTPLDIGRSPAELRTLAETGRAQIFMGCGRYVESARPGEVARDPAFYRDEILSDLLEGADGVRAAVIGEIGTSSPITALEVATLRGAAQAQARTGAPLLVHVELWDPKAHEALDIVEAEGADLSRTVICHLDCSLLVRELDYHISVLARGALIGFDTWGDELAYGENQQPSDERRIDALLELAERGLADRVLHSHDICTKTQLRRFGGPGYGHVPGVIAPRLRERGLTHPDVERLLVSPAIRLLTEEPVG